MIPHNLFFLKMEFVRIVKDGGWEVLIGQWGHAGPEVWNEICCQKFHAE